MGEQQTKQLDEDTFSKIKYYLFVGMLIGSLLAILSTLFIGSESQLVAGYSPSFAVPRGVQFSARSTSLKIRLLGPRPSLLPIRTAMSSEPDGVGSSPLPLPVIPGRVVVVGSANQDLTAYASKIPKRGETILGTAFETSCGGKGANQAVAAASLDISPVSMVCRVGADDFGSQLLANFDSVGITYDRGITVVDNPKTSTGVAPIIVDSQTGDNIIVVVPGANDALGADDVRSAILSMSTPGEIPPSIVLVQLEISQEAALEALRVGKEVGAFTILNPAPAPMSPLPKEFYKYVDLIIPNETELRTLCAEEASQDEDTMAKALISRGASSVIVTLGARGALIVSQDWADKDGELVTTHVNALPNLPSNSLDVVDTVGAGDAFCGSLAAYLSAGLRLTNAATNACSVASMSVRKRGAQPSYPRASELPSELCVESKISLTSRSSDLCEITFVTGNKKKAEEVGRILGSGKTESNFVITNHKIDLPELQGEPVEIAIEKCRLAAKEVGGVVITEDTSLCFNALSGLPGVYIKWFLEKCGHCGLNDMLVGFADKSAYAQTVVALSLGPGEEVLTFVGTTNGTIVPPRGSLDFGWDPIFEPKEGNGLTYAEMSKDGKDSISHRARAFKKLKHYLSTREWSIDK